ncbi:hypothetical protein HHK36_012719 [Tetracentron sinense]|uniref:ENT domain-containing protein n=1 Tax=Tetracentron sinense TaxID=13715 RepID=A0A835DFS2_TETSI|nr:hypothetical protein HHK36_012719 [Tetracentron sinense]
MSSRNIFFLTKLGSGQFARAGRCSAHDLNFQPHLIAYRFTIKLALHTVISNGRSKTGHLLEAFHARFFVELMAIHGGIKLDGPVSFDDIIVFKLEVFLIMKFKIGNNVEVLRGRKDPYGSWFPGKIISEDGDNYIVRYKLLLDHGEPVVEKVYGRDVRPLPQPVKGEKWMLGDIAEVFDIHSWRVGKVAKVGGNEETEKNLAQNSSIYFQGLGCETPEQSIREESQTRERNGQEFLKRDGQEHFKIFHDARTLKRDRDCCFRSSPSCNVMGGSGKKRKATIKEGVCDRPSMITLPLLKQVDDVSSPKVKVGAKCMNGSSEMDVKTDKRDNYSLHPSSMPVRVTEESNECSVSSYSSNDYPGYTAQNSRKSSKNIAGSSFDDAESLCPVLSERKCIPSCSGTKLEINIHKLELHAYKSTMQALHASGPLSWEQESLLTNLRILLHISNEEHLLQLRHLLSAQVL